MTWHHPRVVDFSVTDREPSTTQDFFVRSLPCSVALLQFLYILDNILFFGKRGAPTMNLDFVEKVIKKGQLIKRGSSFPYKFQGN